MKTTKALWFAALLCCVGAARGATPSLFVFGPVNFKITATYRSIHPTVLRSSSYSATTNVVAGVTNVSFVRKSIYASSTTATNATIDNEVLLGLLEKSFKTNFPPGAQLYGTGLIFKVMDATGTNEVLDVTPALHGALKENLATRILRRTVTETEAGTTETRAVNTRATADVEITYDDVALQPEGEIYSTWSVRGRMVGTISETETQFRAQSVFRGLGSGELRAEKVLLNGTMLKKPATAVSTLPGF